MDYKHLTPLSTCCIHSAATHPWVTSHQQLQADVQSALKLLFLPGVFSLLSWTTSLSLILSLSPCDLGSIVYSRLSSQALLTSWGDPIYPGL